LASGDGERGVGLPIFESVMILGAGVGGDPWRGRGLVVARDATEQQALLQDAEVEIRKE